MSPAPPPHFLGKNLIISRSGVGFDSASSYAHLGRLDEPRTAFQGRVRLQPGYSLAIFRVTFASADPDVAERFIDGLRKTELKQ